MLHSEFIFSNTIASYTYICSHDINVSPYASFRVTVNGICLISSYTTPAAYLGVTGPSAGGEELTICLDVAAWFSSTSRLLLSISRFNPRMVLMDESILRVNKAMMHNNTTEHTISKQEIPVSTAP